MTRLAVLGAGGHGRVVAEAAAASGRFRAIVFLDDRAAELEQVDGRPVVARFEALEDTDRPFDAVALGVGDGALRRRLADLARARGVPVEVIAHPSAVVSPTARLGDGVFVGAQAVVQTGAILAEACIVNTSASVDHDARIGGGSHIAPGAHLGGDVDVGETCWIGIGASVREGVRIGDGTIVGAGAAVVSDLPAGVVAVGVPARPLRMNEDTR